MFNRNCNLYHQLLLQSHSHSYLTDPLPEINCFENDSFTVKYPNFSFRSKSVDSIHSNGDQSGNKARLGWLETPHGTVETPNFVFCATKAVMKGMTPLQLRAENTQIILSNTYHLMLTPGSKIVQKMGGLQKFTGWHGPMLTDSGGYQIFSMGYGSVSDEIKGRRDSESMGWNQTLLKIDEDGATFRSYVDGVKHYLTPERSIQIQRELGADLIVVLDECTPFNVDKSYTEDSMRRSHRWAMRSLMEFNRSADGTQALYGIIQGGIYEDLRDESVSFINNHSFFGTAIGGSLGGTKQEMYSIVAYTRNRIRDDRPAHLLGIGGVRDIFHGVRLGIDTFDCVHPSRLGRHGGALVMTHHWDEETYPEDPETPMTLRDITRANKIRFKELQRKKSLELKYKNELQNKDDISDSNNSDIIDGKDKDAGGEIKLEVKRDGDNNRGVANKERVVREHINLSKSRMRNDPRPIDSTCNCYTCKNFSRAYLHHLFKAKEVLGGSYVTIHNVHFMNRLMADIRQGILTNDLDGVEKRYVHPKLMESLQSSNEDETGSEAKKTSSIGT
eukprot:gene4443-6283_t